MILVTGASGLLGANFILASHQSREEVVGVYHKHKLEIPGTRLVASDLTSAASVDALLKQDRPEWIIHCAALTDVEYCETHPDESYKVNVEAPLLLATAASRMGIGFVYISTDSIFDGAEGGYTEQSIPRPINIYATTKLEGERAVQSQVEDALIVRTNIYGWNAREKNSLAEWVLNRLMAGAEVPGFADVYFSPILVNDFCDVILEMISRDLGGIYNVAGYGSVSKFEFAVAIARMFGMNEELVHPTSIDDSPLKAARPKNMSLRTEKISQELGRQMPAIEEGLLRFKRCFDTGYRTKLKAVSIQD